MTFIIQIACDNGVGKSARRFTKDEMLAANAALNECCSKLEQLGYISADLSVEGKSVSFPEIQDWEDI